MNKQMTSVLAQGDQTQVILQGTNNEVIITSVELVEMINIFRKEEGNETEKQHKELLRDIRREIEVLEAAGIGQRNFAQSSYINKQNKEQPCYSLNKAGILQMLNKESAVVRYRTVQYIEKLENTLKEQVNPYAGLSKELQAIFAIDHKQQEMNSRITKLENTMTIDYGQQEDLRLQVAKRVMHLTGGTDMEAYKNFKVRDKVFREIYRHLKHGFSVNSYRNIAVKDYQRAIAEVKNYVVSEELSLMIKGANSQMRLV